MKVRGVGVTVAALVSPDTMSTVTGSEGAIAKLTVNVPEPVSATVSDAALTTRAGMPSSATVTRICSVSLL